MFTILKKQNLGPRINAFHILAPQVAKEAQPGQFVVIRLHGRGERIPLTIADQDLKAGTILLICQTFGKTSFLLNRMEEGEAIADLLGPLAHPGDKKLRYCSFSWRWEYSILSKAKALKKARIKC